MQDGWENCDKTTKQTFYYQAVKQLGSELGYDDLEVARVVQWISHDNAKSEFKEFCEETMGRAASAMYSGEEDEETGRISWTIVMGPRDLDGEEEYENYIELHTLAHEMAHALLTTERIRKGIEPRHEGMRDIRSMAAVAEEGYAEVVGANLMPRLAEIMGWGRDELGQLYDRVQTRNTANPYPAQRMAMNIILGLVGGHWTDQELYQPEFMPITIREIGVTTAIAAMATDNIMSGLARPIAYLHDITETRAQNMVDLILSGCLSEHERNPKQMDTWIWLTARVRNAGIELEDLDDYELDMATSILADQALPA